MDASMWSRGPSRLSWRCYLGRPCRLVGLMPDVLVRVMIKMLYAFDGCCCFMLKESSWHICMYVTQVSELYKRIEATAVS